MAARKVVKAGSTLDNTREGNNKTAFKLLSQHD
jgi:hypothetical protein